MKLTILDGSYVVLKLTPNESIPEKIFQSPFYSVSKSDEELSIVCHEDYAIDTVDIEKNWKILKVEGPLSFDLTGVLSSIAKPLAQEEVSIFAISTFDTDFIMVKNDKLTDTKSILGSAGFEFR